MRKLRTKSVYTLRRDIARRLAKKSVISFVPANWVNDKEYEIEVSGDTGVVNLGNGLKMVINLEEESITEDMQSSLPSANIVESYSGIVEWDDMDIDVVILKFKNSRHYIGFISGDPRNITREAENPYVVAAQLAFNSW